ncbi:ArfGap-domain-containing protein [Viridothelium virens]|uniref:ArfGap-domain-containing protein n=1 Tax=Viridothelium virens TaxID=1048519 RepID=A0A6A6HCF9_VIRVR|nr:ArfGap-domain-containing protein [Viridothelium virens]
MWEVDPETRSKLLEIQKENGNNQCVDCNAPSPQWASPKFGIFMCLNCSGIHRGLGVHISFVRSITMDAFKAAELLRMKNGGNQPWKDFFNNHKTNQLQGITFEDSTINDRYDSEVGEEWKDRLTAKVEGKEYVPGIKTTAPKKKDAPTLSASNSRSQTPVSRTISNDRINARSPSPSLGISSVNPKSQKAQNEAYFAKMGAANASRSDDVPPNQGGKYGGFGSSPMPAANPASPGLDEFQRDPVGALTKGFGWLSTTVGKQANAGYQGWVKPNVEKLAQSDLAAQARRTATQVSSNLNQNFTRFVEGNDDHLAYGDPKQVRQNPGVGPDADHKDFWDSFGEDPSGPGKDKEEFWDSFGSPPKGPSAEKKDFWDEFSAAGETRQAKTQPSKSTSIGTSAMKKTPAASTTTAKKDEDWGEW